MKKKVVSIVLTAVMAASIAACGQADTTTTAGSEASTSAAAETSAADTASADTAAQTTTDTADADTSTASGDVEKLTIAARGGTYADVLNESVKQFEQDNNCEVDVLELESDDLHSKIALDSANAEGAYDLAMVDGSWIAEFTEGNYLLDLTKEGYSYDDDLIPATYATAAVDGDACLIPFYGNVTVMMYNKELVKAAGYTGDDIDSWDDVKKIAQSAHDAGKNGYVTRGGGADPVLTDFYPLLLANGTDLVDKDNNPTVDTDTFKTALTQYMDLQALGETMEKDDMVANVENGDGALAVIWPGWYSPTEDGPADYCVIPAKLTDDGQEQNTSVLGVWDLAVMANTTHKDLAVKLIEYLTDKDVQMASVENGGVPCRKSILEDADVLAAHPQFAAIEGALEKGASRPVMTQWSDFCEILGTEIDSICTGVDDMDTGLANAQSQLEELMAE